MAKIIAKLSKYIAVACGLTLLLASCAQVPVSKPLHESWEVRQQQLSALTSWQFRGRVIFKMPNKKMSANVFWQQQPESYQVMLFGPFGLGEVQLEGRLGQVRFKDDHGNIYTARDPESLLQERLGLSLPISSLYYWVRGLPAPNSVTNTHYDAFHRITLLEQQGWKVHYLTYIRVQTTELPIEITFEKEGFFMKLTIEGDSWQVKR